MFKTQLIIALLACCHLFSCKPYPEELNQQIIDTVKVDKGFQVIFYSMDTVNIDSIYFFNQQYDTTLLTTIDFRNNSNIKDRVKLTLSSDSIKITLLKPKHDYLSINCQDTIFWGPTYPNNSITIPIQYKYMLNDFYIQNWGILPLADTIGSTGIQTAILIKMSIEEK